MAAANDHLTNPRTMEGGESQRTESVGQGEETQEKSAYITTPTKKDWELNLRKLTAWQMPCLYG